MKQEYVYESDDYFVEKLSFTENTYFDIIDANEGIAVARDLKSLKDALMVIRRLRVDEVYRQRLIKKLAPKYPFIPGIPSKHIIHYEELREELPAYGLVVKRPGQKMPHVVLAHELGHQKAKHSFRTRLTSGKEEVKRQEKEAWKEAAKSLRRSGEWTARVREEAML